MALRIDTASINADRERSASDDDAHRPLSPSDADMEDLALSPMVHDATDSLMPLSMTDSASGERPLPSLHGPITYRDVPFIGAFVAHLLFTIIATNAVRQRDDTDSDSDDNTNAALPTSPTDQPSNSDAALSASDIGVALRSLCVINLLVAVGVVLVFAFTSKLRFLRLSSAFSTVGLLTFAALLLSLDTTGSIVVGVVVTLTAVVDLVWMLQTQHHLDFVSELLTLVVECLLQYPSLVLVVAVVMVVYTIWTSWLCTTLAFIGGDANSIGPYNIMVVYLYGHFYWTANVLTNVVTVVVAGATMLWYYKDTDSSMTQSSDASIKEEEDDVIHTDTHPNHLSDIDMNDTDAISTQTGFLSCNSNSTERRVIAHYTQAALTRSFGSICIGALLSPLAHVLWTSVRLHRQYANAPIVRRLLFKTSGQRIHEFIQTAHKFAFVHVAGYSKPFGVAAHDAWQLLEARGVEAIVDADPTSRLLLLSANGVASVMAALCLSALVASQHVVLYGVVAFVLSYTTLSLLANVVLTVVKTLCVCFAEHPTRLSQLNPLIYHRFVRLSELQSFRDHKQQPAGNVAFDA